MGTVGGLSEERHGLKERECPTPAKQIARHLQDEVAAGFPKNRDVLSVCFSVAFSRLFLPCPGKEKHRIKDKGLCLLSLHKSTSESTQETRHRGDGNSSGSRKLKQDVTKRDVCPTQDSLEKLAKIMSFPT